VKAKAHRKRHLNKRSKRKSFVQDDKVLLLQPVSNSDFLLQWKGPYTIETVLDNGVDYRVSIGYKIKIFQRKHAEEVL